VSEAGRRRRLARSGPFARRMAVALALIAGALPLSFRAEAEVPPPPPVNGDYLVDKETGHPFRVRFNPARHFALGVGAAFQPLSDEPITPTLQLDLDFTFRAVFKYGEGLGRVLWQIDHTVLSGWTWPLERLAEGVPAMDVVGYSVSLHRHDEGPRIVLPTSPPASIPFPFDIGLEAEVVRVFVPGVFPESTGALGPLPMLRVGVLRAAAFLDPWRSEEIGHSFEIGLGARYDVDFIARSKAGSVSDSRKVHRIAPMTAASLRFRLQTDDGLMALDLRGDFIPHWTTEQTWKIMALGRARIERTLLAINDEPIVFVLDAGYRRSPESELVKAMNDLRVTLGLTFNIQIPEP